MSCVLKILLYHLLIVCLLYTGYNCGPCKIRSYGYQNFVCVCNEMYCDDLVLRSDADENQAVLYETNKDGARFKSSLSNFSSSPVPGIPVLTVNSSNIHQLILGFGGAFTDASGINMKSVSSTLQTHIMNSYFSESGLQYNMGRVPMASCDFSTYAYSYDDVKGDFSLKNFQLTKEDFSLKIPFIKYASSLAKEQLLLVGSPWSAPSWMKTNNAMNGKGGLKGNPGGKYYQTWANYFVRFLDAYQDNNITFWGVTLQNEPMTGCIDNFPYQAMCFHAEQQRDFLKLDLGPALKSAGFTSDKLKLMIMDSDRVLLPMWADIIMTDASAAQYVSGIAFHWYYEGLMPHELLNITHSKYPNLFLLSTEASTGYNVLDYPKVSLGSWKRAERYAHDIIQDLLNWSIGWIDWNLVLDMHGGPSWAKNFVDSPIIVNAKAAEFYKQPMYYILAHFSKCLPRGSARIGLEMPDKWKNFDIAAFQTPKNKIVVVAVNREDEVVQFILHDSSKGFLNVTISAHSIQSYMW